MALIRATQIHEQEMARYRQARSETLTIRSIGIALIVAIAAVLMWVTYTVWDSTQSKQQIEENIRVTCIQAGGTWVASYSTGSCIQDGGVIAPTDSIRDDEDAPAPSPSPDPSADPAPKDAS